MKKTILSVIMACLFLFSGCAKEYTLANGLYAPAQSGEKTELPYILVYDDSFTVVMDIAVSYQPSGEIVKEGNEVMMECLFADKAYKWVFQLTDNNRLKLALNKSVLPSESDQWEEGMEFVLTEN